MGGRYFDQIGYMPQYPQFYAILPYRNFGLYVLSKGVANAKRASDAALVFRQPGGKPQQADPGRCPAGCGSGLGIAQVLWATPRLLVLDEPTAGLDPGERFAYRNGISSLAKGAYYR